MNRFVLSFLLLILLGRLPSWSSTAAAYYTSAHPENVTESESLDTARRAIAREEARAWKHLEKLAAFETLLQEQQEEVVKKNEEILTRIAAFGAELSQIKPGSPDAGNLWWQVNSVIRKDREQLSKNLDDWGAPPEFPAFSPTLLLQSMAIPQLDPTLSELRALFATVYREEERLRNQYRDLQRQRILLEGKRLMRARVLSVSILKQTAFGGWAAFYRDFRQGSPLTVETIKLIGILVRFHTWQRVEELKNFITESDHIFVLGEGFFKLLKMVVVILFIRFGLLRFQQLIRQKKKNFNLGGQWESGRLVIRRVNWFSMIEAAAPWTFFLIGVWVIQYLLRGEARWPEFDFLLLIVFLYGAYRLAVNVLVEVVMEGGRLFHMDFSGQEKASVTGSVQAIMGSIFLLAVFLAFVKQLTSASLLYDVFTTLSFFIILGVLFFVFRGWCSRIVATYLKMFPDGIFAVRLRNRQQGLLATLAAPFLFLILALLSALVLVQAVMDRFEGSRKLLNLLSRKMIERRAESRGWAEGELEELPDSVLRVFGSEEVLPEILVDNFPGQMDLAEALENWRAGRMKGSFLLVGDRGIGKRCWILNADLPKVETIRITLQKRIMTVAEFASYLAPVLLPGREKSASLKEIREALLTGKRRLILMEFCQNLFLAKVGGYEVYEAFSSLVEETSMRVFWLCSMNRSAWSHLGAVRGSLSPFRWIRVLDRWSPQDIRKLLHKRVEASGVRFDYKDLQLGGYNVGHLGQSNELAEEDYAMLLWDYTSGNPHLALHFFLRSLIPAGPAMVRIRLFKPPHGEELGAIGEVAPLLAAMVRHDTLTLEEAVAVCRCSPGDGTIYLNWLHDIGATDEENGRYRIAPFWYPEVRRYLKRKNLLTE